MYLRWLEAQTHQICIAEDKKKAGQLTFTLLYFTYSTKETTSAYWFIYWHSLTAWLVLLFITKLWL